MHHIRSPCLQPLQLAGHLALTDHGRDATRTPLAPQLTNTITITHSRCGGTRCKLQAPPAISVRRRRCSLLHLYPGSAAGREDEESWLEWDIDISHALKAHES